MKPGLLILLFLLASAFSARCVCAQTLTERLLKEDPADLVDSAQKNGNIVRGAILYHQGNTNCARCHRPSSEANRIGPDLSRLDPEVTANSIVESILLPSKSITKGYETVTVLTDDGIQFVGTVAEEDTSKIVLRDRDTIGRQVIIPRETVDEMRPAKISTMPELLVDGLSNRQQFLDLLRYVLDVRRRGPADNAANEKPVGKLLSPELEGLLLIQEMNCVACHDSQLADTGVAANVAPDLDWSREHLNPRYLAEFIADPHRTKPGTNMPDMLQALGEETAVDTANAIVHFLQANIDNRFNSHEIDTDSISRGNDLFHSVGCVACHSPRDPAANETGLDGSIPLGNLTPKYSLNSLVEFLKDPCAIRPAGRMPDLALTDREAKDVASYLLQGRIDVDEGWTTNATLASQGKMLFAVLGCASCHTKVVKSNRQILQPPALEESQPDQGCLSGKPGRWPNFNLNQRQMERIRVALKRGTQELTSEQKVGIAIRAFNCNACHARGELAGVTITRDPHFQTTNVNLGDQGRIPPTLTGVGAKLKPVWMRNVLVNGHVIRPYMKTRMPQYGEANIGHLVELLENVDTLPAVTQAPSEDPIEMREYGLMLAGNKGLNCIACHTYNQKFSDTMPAVDLTEMAERLKKNWFYHYMMSPDRFSHNTVMPSYWPGGKAICEEFEGDPSFQIEALWQFLAEANRMGQPSSSKEDKDDEKE